MKKLSLKEIRELAESLGFAYRAKSETASTSWITFTYPDTNSHVILIEPDTRELIMKTLGNELVRCGRIQQRQAILREINPWNYS